MTTPEAPARLEGSWWLPSNPTVQLNGFVELGDSHTLTVFGSLNPDPSGDVECNPDVIHGLCNGRYITLIECSTRFDSTQFAGFATSTYFAPVILSGHVDFTRGGPTFDQVEVTLDRMVEFSARTGIRRDFGDEAETARHEPALSLSAEYAGVTYELHSDFYGQAKPGFMEWREKEVLAVTLPDRVPIQTVLQRVLGPFLNLLNLASGYPTSLEALRVRRSIDAKDGLSPWADVSIYAGAVDPAEQRSVQPQQYLVTLDDVPFDMLIPRWLSLVDALGLTLDILFSLDRPQAGFVSSRFFNAAAAAEGIHRRLYPDQEIASTRHVAKVARILRQVSKSRDRSWLRSVLKYSHQPTFATRMYRLLEDAGGAFAPYVSDREQQSWVGIITRLRNIVAHSLNDDDIERRPAALHRLGSSLSLLLRIVLVRRLGVPEELLQRRLRWHMQWSYLPEALRRDVPELFE